MNDLLPKIMDNLFQIFKQADRGFVIMREEVTEREKTVDRLIPRVIKTRRPQDESSASYSRSIVRECLKTVQALRDADRTPQDRVAAALDADFVALVDRHPVRELLTASEPHERFPPLGVDPLVLEVQRERFERPGPLDGRAGRAPATARPLAAGALERRDVVRALELGANVLVVQLTRPFRRYFDPHPHDGVGEPIRLASDRPHHVLGGVITFYFRLNG